MKRDPKAEAEFPFLKELGDAIEALEALEAVTYEQDQTCARCGRREIVHVRDPAHAGAVTVICQDCSTADRPTQHPDTGWTH